MNCSKDDDTRSNAHVSGTGTPTMSSTDTSMNVEA